MKPMASSHETFRITATPAGHQPLCLLDRTYPPRASGADRSSGGERCGL
jgi:hypothetical protein